MKRALFLMLGVIPSLLFGSLYADTTSGPVDIELVSEHKEVKPGEPFWVGIHFKMDDGWHTSWKNPGDAGFAPQLEWVLPEGFSVGDVQWPAPEKFEQDALTAFGYEGEAVLLAQIIPSSTFKEGDTAQLGVDVTFVACKDSCVPGNVSAYLNVTGGTTSIAANPLFEKARARMPQSSDAIVARLKGDRLILKGQGDYSEAYFFPEGEGVMAQQVSQQGNDLHIQVDKASMGAGVVVLMGESPLAVQVMSDLAVVPAFSAMQLLLAIGGAFFGGMILNLMPCVLPVISLKILSFVNLAGSDRKKIFKHGLMFTIGVIVSFLVLAGALLILRAYGESVGWGFQLQSPMFIVILMIVLFLLALSLLGVFEIGTSLMGVGQGKQRKGYVASFLSGVLATVVATPCTGPLLAPALGFAVTLPAALSLFVFSMMGLGMASPYLLFSAFPKLVQKLPKPGPWMVVFKQVMGFILLATVLWLLWVFQAQVSSVAVVAILGSLFVLAIGAWIFGRWGNPTVKRTKRYVAIGISLAILAAGTWFGTNIARSGETQVEQISHSGWIPWDAEKFAELRAEGVPVFVDFTAKWCLICQTNKAPIHSADVQKVFEERGVVMMEADWTRRDPAITEELARFGRNGVPLYVFYGVEDEPTIFPQLLTKKALIEAANTVND